MEYRDATAQDVEACVYIAKVMHAGSQFADNTTYIDEDATEHAHRCIKNASTFFKVAEKEGEVIAFFIAGSHPVVWNKNQWVSSEQLFFILPEHASPRIALRFFRLWEDWCKERGIVQMSFCPTSFISHDFDRWDSFCDAVSFKRNGTSYRKVLR